MECSCNALSVDIYLALRMQMLYTTPFFFLGCYGFIISHFTVDIGDEAFICDVLLFSEFFDCNFEFSSYSHTNFPCFLPISTLLSSMIPFV